MFNLITKCFNLSFVMEKRDVPLMLSSVDRNEDSDTSSVKFNVA